MPTYDYECDACGHTEEIFQPITAEPLDKCPKCKKKKFKRLFGTGAAVVFKGSGFYQTDYRSESYRKAAEKEAKAGESSGKSEGESKGDAKSAGKGEGKSSPAGGEKPAKPAQSSSPESTPAKPKKKKDND